MLSAHASEKKDRIFKDPDYPKTFVFDQKIANVFEDMLDRCVPLYRDVTEFLASLAKSHLKAGDRVYDLGCSTGTTLQILSNAVEAPLKLVGLDPSEAMIEKAKGKLKDIRKENLELLCEDMLKHSFKKSNLIICNYTLQFTPFEKREGLLKSFYDSLEEGSFLYISEKIKYSDPKLQDVGINFYENFKLRNGYSKEENLRKKEALKNFLVPSTIEELTNWLKNAGFQKIEVLFKWNSFVTLVAFK